MAAVARSILGVSEVLAHADKLELAGDLLTGCPAQSQIAESTWRGVDSIAFDIYTSRDLTILVGMLSEVIHRCQSKRLGEIVAQSELEARVLSVAVV